MVPLEAGSGPPFRCKVKLLTYGGGTKMSRSISQLSGAAVPPVPYQEAPKKGSPNLNALSFEQMAIKVAGSVENFYSRDHLRYKIKAGEFPRPVYLSSKKQVWVEAEIDRYLTELAAKRELRGAK
jgi:predicted DNA-binding transcriptional regulator AlpA